MRCSVAVPFPREQDAEAVMSALRPEVISAPSKRSAVELEKHGETLSLTVRASDISGMRAALNSYLRWLILMQRILEITEMVYHG